ncbi:MAG: FG-GAP-like repeat-containing protein [Bacteroidales bacterium]|nr:FG-GAP-like repeat-containing protein [Bacteroidales bacterium]
MKRFISVLLMSSMLSTVVAAQTLVGSMGGQFAVNEMGAATYTIPIEVPVGINGVQPNVNLVYDSHTGNGVCGVGFSISASSSITRVPRTIYYDGVAKGIKYDTTDAYALDGQRLILYSGTEGKEGAVYNLENDPLTKVTIKGSGANMWFQVEAGGQTMRYGKETKSRQNPNSSRNSLWFIDYSEDAHGNYMKYSYTCDDYSNCLSSIFYGKNASDEVGNSNVVIFGYETRPDVLPFITDGLSGKLTKRLKTISLMVNGSVQRTYELTYVKNDAYSRLVQVMKKSNSQELVSNSFSWNKMPSTCYSPSSVTGPESPSYMRYVNADWNGDGRDEVVAISVGTTGSSSLIVERTNKAYVYESDGNMSFTSGSDKTFTLTGDMVLSKGTAVADLYGNGESSVVIPCGTSLRSIVFYSISKSKGLVKMPLDLVNRYLFFPAFTFADFNNDGKSEGILIECSKGVKQTSSGYPAQLFGIDENGSFKKWANFSLEVEASPSQIVSSDFNGDGLTDIMVIHKNGYTIFKNNGGGLSATTFTSSNKVTGTDVRAQAVVQAGDFNGDGYIDFVTNATDSRKWYMHINNGNCTFTTTEAWTSDEICEQSSTTKDDTRFECKVLDFNHDGKDDMIITKAHYTSSGTFDKTYTYWLSSSGTSFSKVQKFTSPNEDDALEYRSMAGDFDGDGFIDMLAYDNNIYGNSTTKNVSWHFYKKSGITPASGLLASITGDMKRKITLGYASLSNSSVYSKGAKSFDDPLTVIQAAYPVVRSVVSSGAGYAQTTTFTYEGLCVHRKGRGCLGFMKRTSKNSATGVSQTTEVLDINKTVYVPTKVRTTTSLGNSSITNEAVATVQCGTKQRYMVSQIVQTKTDMYKNVTTVTEKRNTTYGYLLSSTTSSDGGKMTLATTYSNQILAGGVYKPQKVTTTSKHADDTSSFTSVMSYTYDTKTGDVKSEVAFSDQTNKITHSYTYDTYGNVLTHKQEGVGVSSVTESFEYEKTKRFVNVSKNSATGQTFSYTYDLYGRPLTEVNISSTSSPLPKTFTYDACGNMLTSRSPEGIVTTFAYGWGTASNKRYYITTKTDGKPQTTVWYDELGREVLAESTGELGMKQTVSCLYNAKGLLASKVTTTGSMGINDTYGYDEFGRLVTHTSTSGANEKMSYGNRTVTTTSGGRTTIQKTDAWGNAITVTDAFGSVTTYKYSSNGGVKSINSAGATTTVDYDAYGRKISLNDPDAGTTTYSYDGFGRVVKSTDAKGNVTTNEYDGYGRLISVTQGGQVTTYSYGNSSKFLLPVTVSNTNSTIKYSYDNYNRPLSKTVTTGSETMSTSYSYNSLGQVEKMTYPNGSVENLIYDSNGYIKQIRLDGMSIWELKSSTGQKRTVARNDKIETVTSLNTQGLLSSQQLSVSGTVKNSLTYSFDGSTGDLLTRKGMTGVAESFTYDAMDRLKEVKNGSSVSMSMTYAANGNIASKTGLGKYTYSTSKPHALIGVENTSDVVSHETQSATFTPFNKVSKLTERHGNATFELTISYGPDNQRCKTQLKAGGAVSETRYYADCFERLVKGSTKTDILYVNTPEGLTYIKMGTTGYQVMTDHLGSIVKMYDASGNQKYSASYDVWGTQTVTMSVAGIRRGFTGHEHWNEFGLIDMNGRFYDPQIARFLSPDIFVQNPKNSQSFNRYSYCVNNPLKYTDPSGYVTQNTSTGRKTITNRFDVTRPSEGGNVNYKAFGSNAESFMQGLGLYGKYDMSFDERYAGFDESGLMYMDYECIMNYSLDFSSLSGLSNMDLLNLSRCFTASEIANYLSKIHYPLPTSSQQSTSRDVVCTAGTYRYYLKLANNILMDGGQGSIVKETSNINWLGGMLTGVGHANSLVNSAASGVTGGKAFPNAKVGSNGKLYLSGNFHGNQYVNVISLKAIASKTTALGLLLSAGQVFYSWRSEGYWGSQTQNEAVGAVGGIAGGIAGTWVGCEIGAFFWGVGAVPGAVIGFIGGCVGSYGGAWGAQNAYNNYIKE